MAENKLNIFISLFIMVSILCIHIGKDFCHLKECHQLEHNHKGKDPMLEKQSDKCPVCSIVFHHKLFFTEFYQFTFVYKGEILFKNFFDRSYYVSITSSSDRAPPLF